jgi:hypothetical protein
VQTPAGQGNDFVLTESGRFVLTHWLKLFVLSVLVLVPCFWHREIVSSDLGSHLYNAWLVQLIHKGQVPGLWVTSQRDNVLFDLLLSGLGSAFGLHAAERIAVSFCVIVFFWGTFALVSAAARRAPWFLVPCIAVFAYGWTFHAGLFNYYLSLGLASFSLAIHWRGKGWEQLLAIVFALLSLAASPLGFAWLLAAGAYIVVAERTPGRPAYQFGLFAAGAAALVTLHLYMWRHYELYAGTRPLYAFNGADQLLLFGPRYRIPELVLLAFAVISFVTDVVSRRGTPGFWKQYAIPVQLYLLTELGIYLLPGGIYSPPPRLALLTERFTSISAVVGCCILGVLQPRKCHLVASACIAAVFFSFLYQDTATVNRMEQQIVEWVSQLPPNQRVIGTILPPRGSRITLQHIVDRACIGRCFSYGNYEASTNLFRVHAAPGNPYLMNDYESTVDVEHGHYRVQPGDLPLYQVYQSRPRGTDLRIRPLQAGEENNAPVVPSP